MLAWNRSPRGSKRLGVSKDSLHRELKLSPKVFDQHILDMHSAFKKTFRETQQQPFHHWPAGFENWNRRQQEKCGRDTLGRIETVGKKVAWFVSSVCVSLQNAMGFPNFKKDSHKVSQTTFFIDICVFVRRLFYLFPIKLNLLLLSPTLKLSGPSCDWNHMCWGLISHRFPVVRDCHQPNSSVLLTYSKDSLLGVGWPFPM